MSAIAGLRAYYNEFGLGGVASIARFRLTGRPEKVRVRMHGLRHPLTIRMRSTDHQIFRDIFQHHEYLFHPSTPPATIIDAGANIGFASVYFANRWPNAHIVAIEPDPENFELLVENTKRYPGITQVRAAVWKENTRLDLFDPGKGSWAMQTKVSADGSVEGLTIPEIMRRYEMPRVDFLKMDIEGAEKEVFEGYAGWINLIGDMVVEIHDQMKPGAKAAVLKTRHHFKHIYDNGEAGTWYLLREKTERPTLPRFHRGQIMAMG